jgi:hypothetical protein
MHARSCAAVAAVTLTLSSLAARAQEQPPPVKRAIDPLKVSGVDRAASERGDFAREALGAVLWFPRQAIDYLYLATGAAAGVVQDQQIVPRVEELLNPRPGDIVIFPTAFAETGRAVNIGARMIATGRNVTTSLRGGFGGVDDVVGEAKISLVRRTPLPSVLSLEGLADRRSDLQFLGVGETPETDPRNHFLGAPRAALYRERRSRAIVSLGIRPVPDVEIFLSSSLTRRNVDDEPSAGDAALARVFDRSTIPGAFTTSTIAYGEIAVRLDTRKERGKPSPGVLIEGYAGSGRGILGDATRFVRLGGRAAGFIPIYRRSNILSPRIVVDGLAPFGPVPFAELTGEPEFRGFDTRRDHISIVYSLDYRYGFLRMFAARAFVDLSTVLPELGAIGHEAPRFAAGVGLDVSSSSAELGRFAFAASPEGVRFLLSFGVPSGFGDRQHRD